MHVEQSETLIRHTPTFGARRWVTQMYKYVPWGNNKNQLSDQFASPRLEGNVILVFCNQWYVQLQPYKFVSPGVTCHFSLPQQGYIKHSATI